MQVNTILLVACLDTTVACLDTTVACLDTTVAYLDTTVACLDTTVACLATTCSKLQKACVCVLGCIAGINLTNNGRQFHFGLNHECYSTTFKQTNTLQLK